MIQDPGMEMAALEAALGGMPPGPPMGGAGGGTVDCKVCGYVIDVVTGEPVAELGGGLDMGGMPPAPPGMPVM
jgi:hypothetical protein